jgi:protein ImuB
VQREARRVRVLAVHVPELALQQVRRARARGDRADRERPVAIVAEGRVVSCEAEARAEGVRPGATLAAALAACGRLLAIPRDVAAERTALRALAEVMLALAPAVEVAPPDVLLLDASAAHLLARSAGAAHAAVEGGLPGEGELARRALAAAEDMGFSARTVLADGRGPARALARHAQRQVEVVAPGAAARAIAALPIEALGLSPEVAARLGGLGILDAGGLARLPEGTLAHRFGAAGVLAARLARAEDDSPLVAFVPETLPEEALELESPAETADPLLFGLKRLADRVAARLAGRGLGATRLRLVLKLDPRGEERIVAPLSSPSAAVGRWLLPLKESLFSLRLPGAVTGLRLAAVEVAPLAPEQLAIGDRPEVLAALEGVLARLAVRLGDGAMFAAEPVERYRPEHAYRPVPFRPDRARPLGAARGGSAGTRGPRGEQGVLGSTGSGDPPVSEAAPPRPTRLLAMPEPVVAEGEGGRLTALHVGGRTRSVLALDGPERLRGEWWSSPFDRDYYRVRLESLGDCWVYRDGRDGRLYLHGFFD